MQFPLIERTRQGHTDHRFPWRQGNFRVKHIDGKALLTIGSIAIRGARRHLVPIGERGFPTTESPVGKAQLERLRTSIAIGDDRVPNRGAIRRGTQES